MPTELDVVFNALAAAALSAGLVMMFYLAVEPYLRRKWPKTLVSWSRLVAGRVADPMVGRDVLVGVIGGGLTATLVATALILLDEPTNPYGSVLAHPRYIGYLIFSRVANATLIALAIGVFLLLSHLVVRNRIAAIGLTVVFSSIMSGSPGVDPAIEIPMRVVLAVLLVGTFVRFGMLSALTLLFVSGLLHAAPTTLDPSSWLFGRSLIVIATILAIAAHGFYRSLGAQPVFTGAVLDD